jgi:UDP-glucose 4-epimerase
MNRVLITGATGAVGPQVVLTLYNAGYRIRTLSADSSNPCLFCDDIEVFTGDIADFSVVDRAVRGVDLIVHMASLLHINNPEPGLYGQYERVNIDGTKNIVNAATREKVKKVVFFSTISVYGRAANKIITEDTPLQPNTFYARTKQVAEKIVLDARDQNDQPVGTVLRFGAIYGARMKGNYRRLITSLNKGTFVPLGDGFNRRTLIYDKDAAQAVLHSMQHPEAAGKVYNVSDGCFHTLKDIIEAMCIVLKRPFPRITLPLEPVKKIISILDYTSHFFNVNLPINMDIIDKYTEDVAVDSQLIRTQLGFETRYDLISGLKETVLEMKKNDLL